MREAAGHVAAGARVGILFGRERTGLENDDIQRASAIVTVPVNPAFPSLNLAQCALLLGYEWRQAVAGSEVVAEQLVTGRSELACKEDVERLLAHLVEIGRAHV